jgi:hypothetical protein
MILNQIFLIVIIIIIIIIFILAYKTILVQLGIIYMLQWISFNVRIFMSL